MSLRNIQSMRGHRNTYTVMPFIQKGKKVFRLSTLFSGKHDSQTEEWRECSLLSGGENQKRAQHASKMHMCTEASFWSNRFDLKATILISFKVTDFSTSQWLVLTERFGEIPGWPWTLLLTMILNLVPLSVEITWVHCYTWVISSWGSDPGLHARYKALYHLTYFTLIFFLF